MQCLAPHCAMHGSTSSTDCHKRRGLPHHSKLFGAKFGSTYLQSYNGDPYLYTQLLQFPHRSCAILSHHRATAASCHHTNKTHTICTTHYHTVANAIAQNHFKHENNHCYDLNRTATTKSTTICGTTTILHSLPQPQMVSLWYCNIEGSVIASLVVYSLRSKIFTLYP